MFPGLLTLTCILILAFLVWASASIRSGVYLKAFCRAKTADKVVYLTFDDGPAGAETEAVLDHPKDPYTKKLMSSVLHLKRAENQEVR